MMVSGSVTSLQQFVHDYYVQISGNSFVETMTIIVRSV